MTQTTTNSIKFAFKKSLPIMAGYIVLGMGFGILLQREGYNFLWAGLMSITIFAGSMQYVAVDLLSSGASLIVCALMTFMINVRHVFYGLTMLSKYKEMGKTRFYLIFALTDETFSLVCSPYLPDQVDEKKYYFFVSLFNQCYWIIGGVLGALLGQTIQFNSAGVEFSMTALFVIIFLEQWESSKTHFPAIGGILITLISLILFGSQNFLIPAMIGITLMLFMGRKWLESEGAND